MHFNGDLKPFAFLRYDVTSLAAGLRAGGTAAIIGVGGGRDVINYAINGLHRIVGIEVNSAIVGLAWFSGFNKLLNFGLHNDVGRSYRVIALAAMRRTSHLFAGRGSGQLDPLDRTGQFGF